MGVNGEKSDVLEWWFWSLSYLRSADALLEDGNREVDDGLGGLSVVPAYYCLRHGLELFLKFMVLASGEQVTRIHDLRRIAKLVLPADLSANQARLLARLADTDAETIRSALPAHIERRLMGLVYKYERIIDDAPQDTQNTHMRYPSPTVDRWVRSLKSEDLQEFRHDIQEASELVCMFLASYSNLVTRLLEEDDAHAPESDP